MAVRDHDPISFSAFKGTFDRGEDETCPPGFFRSSQNIQFYHGGVGTRDGVVASTFALPAGNLVRRIAIYKRLGEQPRLLVLDSAGHLYDSSTGTIILAITPMIDFS